MGKIAGVFPIGGTGESFLVVEWVPDPEVVAQQLMKFAVDVENMAEPLAAAREAFIYDTSLHFETESDPYGRAWTPLEEEYLKRRQREGESGNILHVTGALEQAATDQGNWLITESDIIFQVDKLPFYGPYHQAGTMDENVQNILHTIRTGGVLGPEASGVDITREGRGKALPQRMFIGGDEDTVAEVEGIFLAWLDGLVKKDWDFGSGTVPVMGTNVRGTFPIISFLPSGQPRLSTGQFGRKI